MTLSNEDVQAFASAELCTFNLSGLSIDKGLALEDLATEILSEWHDLNSPEVMNSRAEYFKIPKTSPKDYREKLLELADGRKLIHGIRHFGGDRNLPFIQLRPNFNLRSRSEALALYELLRSEYEAFKPLSLCFWSPERVDADVLASTYLVTQASEILKLPDWKEESTFSLNLIGDDSYYEWYQAGYLDFHLENPDLKSKVTVNSLESMQVPREQGLLFEVLIDSERVGLIAGERSSLLGHAGIYFHEIFISKKWKGRGLAKAIQRSFVRRVASEDELIWGTIDHSNKPSYQTARSNGRNPIRFECFVKI